MYIQHKLYDMRKYKTLIAIAHRLSNIARLNRINVFEKSLLQKAVNIQPDKKWFIRYVVKSKKFRGSIDIEARA